MGNTLDRPGRCRRDGRSEWTYAVRTDRLEASLSHALKQVQANADQGATAEAAGATGASSMPFPENTQERHITMQQIKAKSDIA